MAGRILATVFMCVAVTLAALHIGLSHPLFCLAGFSLLFIASGISLIKICFFQREWVRRLVLADTIYEDEPDLLVTAMYPLTFFVAAFVLVCHSMSLVWPDWFIVQHRTTAIASELEWVLLGVDYTLRVVALDVFQNFNIHVSGVQLGKVFALNLLSFAFRAVLTVCFWKLIFEIYEAWP